MCLHHFGKLAFVFQICTMVQQPLYLWLQSLSSINFSVLPAPCHSVMTMLLQVLSLCLSFRILSLVFYVLCIVLPKRRWGWLETVEDFSVDEHVSRICFLLPVRKSQSVTFMLQ